MRARWGRPKKTEKEMKPQDIKKTLLAKQQELSSRKIKQEDIAIERTAEVFDEIQQHADRTLALDSLTRDWEISSMITDALHRLDHGDYGICDECGEPVSEKRLAAIPWAKYCIRCQERSDQSSFEANHAQAA
jgi:DnaK suppressor protein